MRRLQELSRAQVDRLDHGADDRQIPAAPNLAGRELRPTVMARQVRGGSPADAGAQPRGVLMAGRHTLQQRPVEVVAPRKAVLDPRAGGLPADPFPRLFPEGPT
jgi:hypothetical protein